MQFDQLHRRDFITLLGGRCPYWTVDGHRSDTQGLPPRYKPSKTVPLPPDWSLRSQVTAAGIAVNAQLRADEQRMKAKVQSDVLERLLAAIEKERKRQELEAKKDDGESLPVLGKSEGSASSGGN